MNNRTIDDITEMDGLFEDSEQAREVLKKIIKQFPEELLPDFIDYLNLSTEGYTFDGVLYQYILDLAVEAGDGLMDAVYSLLDSIGYFTIDKGLDSIEIEL